MAKLVVAIGLVPEEMVGLVKLPTCLMVSVAGALGAQLPLVIVQLNTVVPVREVINAVGLLTSAIVPLPLVTLHVPKPEVGALAFRFNCVAQVVMVLACRLAALEVLSMLNNSESDWSGQTPLLMVHFT